jgi:hypothetical protein
MLRFESKEKPHPRPNQRENKVLNKEIVLWLQVEGRTWMAALKKSTVLSASAEVIRCQFAFTFASLDVNVSALPCAASAKSDSIRIAEQSDWLVSSVVDEYPRRQGPHIPEPVALALQYVAIRLHGESRHISVIFTR